MNEQEVEKASLRTRHLGGEFSSPHLEILKDNRLHQGGHPPSRGFDLPALPFTNRSLRLKIE